MAVTTMPYKSTSVYVPQSSSSLDNNSHSSPGFEKISKTNIYFRNLPRDFTDDKLSTLVTNASHIRSVRAVLDEDTGECKGYGFIDFMDEDIALEAIKNLKCDYPQLEIRFAKEYEPDPNNVYICNLPKAWTKLDLPKLRQIFEEFGEIVSCCLCTEKLTQFCNGTGFVRYAHSNDAANAIYTLNSRQLVLHPDCGQALELKPADHHPPHQRSNRRRASLANTLSHDPMTAHSHLSMENPEDAQSNGNMSLLNSAMMPSAADPTNVNSAGLLSPLLQPFEPWFNRSIVNCSAATYGAAHNHSFLAFPTAAIVNPTLAQQLFWRHLTVTPTPASNAANVTSQQSPDSYCGTNGYNLVALPFNYLTQSLATSAQASHLGHASFPYSGASMYPLQFTEGPAANSNRLESQH